MKFFSSPIVPSPAREWPVLREDLADANLHRMWWLLLTSTALSIGLTVLNLVKMDNPSFVLWQSLDIGGSAVFLLLFFLGRKKKLPLLFRWALSPAYFAFWLVLMDGYYFCTLLSYGETATYALGVVTPALLILLPPRIFLSLLVPNHVIFCCALFFNPSITRELSPEQIYAALANGTLGVLVAGLGAWFLYAAKRQNFRNERIISMHTVEARRAESHLRAILENIPFQTWLKDTEGKFLAVNGEFAQATGLPAEKIIGSTVQTFPADSAMQYLAEDTALLMTREQTAFEQSIDEPRGLRWYEVFKSPVIDDQGSLLGTAGLARDITERKSMETELMAADRAKSEFLATMSHEIRTPMNSVLGYANILHDMPMEPTQREYVESIITSGQLLLSVINDILDFSKIEAGKIILQTEPVRIADLVSRMKQMFDPLAANKKLQLDMTIGEEVPEFVMGDFHRIEQLLVNLLSNAVKFTNQGSVELSVSATPPLENEPGRIFFHVKDTGIGVTPEQVSFLFKPFTQADTTMARQFGGTGLGLVIASRLCELMGGTIEVKSSPKKGSTFVASISAFLPETMESLQDSPLVHTEEKSENDLSSVRVLVVEDNASNRRLMAAMLKRWGVIPALAESGMQAFNMIKAQTFDVVFMDVQMPGQDGLETTRQIREWEASRESPKTHIVALTAFAMTDDRVRCLEAGMDDYLSKPFNPAALRNILVDVAAKD